MATSASRDNRPSGRDEVVEALLDAASELFASDRPAEVSLRGIARAAGVNHGMVHRYFGTRDELIEQLLARMAVGWTARAQSADDFATAVDTILGEAAEAEAGAGVWIRLLAWALLADDPQRSVEVQRRYATLDLLPAMLPDQDPDSASLTTAAVLSLIFGWRFFHPYIRSALHLEDRDFGSLQEAMRQAVRTLGER